MERVRLFLGHLPRDLEWQVVERAMEESCGAEGKEQVYKALNGQLYNMDLDLQREAQRLITLLTDKVAGRTRARSVCSGARTPVCVGKCFSVFFLLSVNDPSNGFF